MEDHFHFEYNNFRPYQHLPLKHIASCRAESLAPNGCCYRNKVGDFEPMTLSGGAHTVNLRVNGIDHQLQIEARVSLLDALREHVGLTGTKKGCNQGACGACTVLVDGERINSCFALAIQYQGRNIVTIEGLATTDGLHPLQSAFIRYDGFQCGYCTPGQICSAVGMIDEFRRGMPSAVTADAGEASLEFSFPEIKERMSGNLCRCGAYVGITEAIQQAYEVMGK